MADLTSAQVDMEEADRIGVELLSAGLVTVHLGKPADAMSLQTTMKRRAGELRYRCLERIEAVVSK